MTPSIVTFFSVAVINHHDQINLEKEEFVLAHGFRGRVHNAGEVWQQATGGRS